MRLVRSPTNGSDQARWDPVERRLEPAVISGADAVINLAGPGIGDRRWTQARKRLVRQARVDATATMAAIAAADHPPAVLLSASAVGWYGDTGDQVGDETAERGTGFLADLCVDWEGAAAQLRCNAQIRQPDGLARSCTV